MSTETPSPITPRSIADMTVMDLFTLLAKGGGLAGYAAIIWLVMQLRSGSTPPVEPQKPVVPPPPPIIKPQARHDVPNAIGRISMGNTGCTATIIGPVADTDDKVAILTAAHCIQVGTKGRMKLKDGREFSFTCVSRDAKPDVAWLVANRPPGEVPYALLASTTPPVGSVVWHQGYGVDRPGNVEKGSFQGVNDASSQCMFTLSVSSGDSGGGIIALEDGSVLSPVCCTSRLSGPGRVYGATPMACAAARPKIVATSSVEAEEMINPTVELPAEGWPSPTS